LAEEEIYDGVMEALEKLGKEIILFLHHLLTVLVLVTKKKKSYFCT
jgi:hypothetical protein